MLLAVLDTVSGVALLLLLLAFQAAYSELQQDRFDLAARDECFKSADYVLQQPSMVLCAAVCLHEQKCLGLCYNKVTGACHLFTSFPSISLAFEEAPGFILRWKVTAASSKGWEYVVSNQLGSHSGGQQYCRVTGGSLAIPLSGTQRKLFQEARGPSVTADIRVYATDIVEENFFVWGPNERMLNDSSNLWTSSPAGELDDIADCVAASGPDNRWRARKCDSPPYLRYMCQYRVPRCLPCLTATCFFFVY